MLKLVVLVAFSNGKKVKSGTMGQWLWHHFPSKNLGCYGDRGAIFTIDDELTHKIRGIVNHGMYERYHHDVIGVSELDAMQAAVLDIKLKHLDDYDLKRRRLRKLTLQNFKSPNLITPSGKTSLMMNDYDCDCHVFPSFCFTCHGADRDDACCSFKCAWYTVNRFMPNISTQTKLIQARYNEVDFKITNMLSEQVISLPMHSVNLMKNE